MGSAHFARMQEVRVVLPLKDEARLLSSSKFAGALILEDALLPRLSRLGRTHRKLTAA